MKNCSYNTLLESNTVLNAIQLKVDPELNKLWERDKSKSYSSAKKRKLVTDLLKERWKLYGKACK